MTTLTLGPTGLSYIRNRRSLSPNYQANTYYIKQGYASAIGFGDAVSTLTGGNVGYIGPYLSGLGNPVLGVFVGVQPYYDTVLQQTVNKRWWAGTESPSADVACWVIDDPDAIFLAQISGGPLTLANSRQNIDLTGNGAPNTYGVSTAALNYSTLAVTSTLPFRIIGPSTMGAPGYDPTQQFNSQPTNGYAEVIMNPGASEFNIGTGI
jgi:hypothetical protein